MKLSPDSKALFLIIHHEFESQGSTIRGDNEYIDALMNLQKRIQKNEDVETIRSEFQQLKRAAIAER